ncbi:MarR family winged helix-turn-helix transcriptional regulator [Naasia lichenicola]|uniref:Winged helix-turn-helix transcriptional regulator n=1 Tax=Naasia lichenicola TaxID=2565933 RepID=A0A4S4FG24_9MICO|nr:MarR family winged helix-turn-helix transcriptional regulator [Naasia lichenicola]THG28634.1 winged helix-turn-helix transcriptional regulator [Naasia lichenicola]
MNESVDTLQSLIISAHRLTRIAAQHTGNGTSPAVWRTLSILINDGPMRIGELAAASRVAQPTMTKIVQNLAAEDLIRRIADVDDARAWLIAITPKGQNALNTWLQQVAESAAPLFSDLTADDWAAMRAVASILERHISVSEVAA